MSQSAKDQDASSGLGQIGEMQGKAAPDDGQISRTKITSEPETDLFWPHHQKTTRRPSLFEVNDGNVTADSYFPFIFPNHSRYEAIVAQTPLEDRRYRRGLMEIDYVIGGLQYVTDTMLDGKDEIAINDVEFDKFDDSVQVDIDVTYQPPLNCAGALATTGGTSDKQEDDEAGKRWIAIVEENLANSDGNLAVRDGIDEGGKIGRFVREDLRS